MARESPSVTQGLAVANAASTPAMTHRRVLGSVIPVIGENLLQTGVSVVDTMIVAALAATAVALTFPTCGFQSVYGGALRATGEARTPRWPTSSRRGWPWASSGRGYGGPMPGLPLSG
ncbi:MAG TPA: hypothetical protein VGR22_02525 [Thermomicrobiales bacterium]|nr:hypothetical protein [Thermomicrobiales bacterium]